MKTQLACGLFFAGLLAIATPADNVAATPPSNVELVLANGSVPPMPNWGGSKIEARVVRAAFELDTQDQAKYAQQVSHNRRATSWKKTQELKRQSMSQANRVNRAASKKAQVTEARGQEQAAPQKPGLEEEVKLPQPLEDILARASKDAVQPEADQESQHRDELRESLLREARQRKEQLRKEQIREQQQRERERQEQELRAKQLREAELRREVLQQELQEKQQKLEQMQQSATELQLETLSLQDMLKNETRLELTEMPLEFDSPSVEEKPISTLAMTSSLMVESQEESQEDSGESAFQLVAGLETGPEPIDSDAPEALPEYYDNLYGGTCGDCCGDCCVECCPPPCCVPMFWIGGVEATFLAPDLDGGGVSYRLRDEFDAQPWEASYGSNDIAVDDFYVAPRVFLGVQKGCCGVVLRYWHMQAAEATFDTFNYSPPSPALDYGYMMNNRMEAYTIDLEGTRSFCCYDSKNTVSFGVRYASLWHDASLYTDAQVNDGAAGIGVISGDARANRRAYGTGFTSSFSGRKPLFCNSCINLFYGVRGSLVWGEIHNSVETDTIEVTSGASAGSYNYASADYHDTTFIGEAQLGLEVDYRVICFPADAFFRVALEYQYWDAGDARTSASSFAGFGGPSPAALSEGRANAYANALKMDLVGLSIGTGFTW